jgi:hypothetical protein
MDVRLAAAVERDAKLHVVDEIAVAAGHAVEAHAGLYPV